MNQLPDDVEKSTTEETTTEEVVTEETTTEEINNGDDLREKLKEFSDLED